MSKVFDWNRAAQILRERNARDAEAGLAEDWFFTAGDILVGGSICEDGEAYLSSYWATPALRVDGEIIACYLASEDTDWDANTVWPNTARNIWEGK